MANKYDVIGDFLRQSDEGSFIDVAYLRYNATSGTQSGTIGCTLTSANTWTITKTNVMYYIDPRDGSGNPQDMTIIIPDAASTNLNQQMTFRKPNLAGDLGTVTIRTVSNQNVGETTTYTFNHPSDYAQLISNEFEFAGGSYKWRQTFDKREAVNTLRVDKNGYYGYSSIQSAINAIKDANSATKPYTICVYPGTYVENIVLKDGVDIKGEGASPFQVKITPTTGTAVSWASGSTYSHLENLQFIGPATTDGSQHLLTCDNGTHLIRECVFDWYITSANASEIVALSAGGDAVVEIDNMIAGYYQYGLNGVTSANQYWLKTAGNSNVYIHNSDVTLFTNTSANNFNIISENSINANLGLNIGNSFEAIIDNVDFNGRIIFYENNADSSERNFSNSSITLSGNAAQGEATIYKTLSTGTVKSSNNGLRIYGFGSNYLGHAVSGSTINSHFDKTLAVNEISGAGTFNYIYAPDDGDLRISHKLRVTDTATVIGLSSNNSVIITDSLGTLLTSNLSVVDGVVGGSILNITEYAAGSEPLSTSLLSGDIYVLNSPSTSGKLLKFYDGVFKYSVELSKE